MDRLERQLGFAAEIGRLKGVQRQTMLASLGRRENSAEHSWHLALMALAMAEHAPPGTDISRVIAMVLIHDLVEIDAGDLFLYADAEQQRRQEEAEQVAARRIFGLLPADQAAGLWRLWDEFMQRRTPEARFARALDRLQPMLENTAAGGGTWHEHHIFADQVLAKVALIDEGSAALGAFATGLVRGAVAAGILAERSAGEEDQLDRGQQADHHDDRAEHGGGQPLPDTGAGQAAER
jgi:5'-deoxynucleotidase YfbR-like HD superfamily hydrolase